MNSMDKGAFTANGYSVEIGDGGSFIVMRGGRVWDNGMRLSEMRGFTNWSDLIDWLTEEHRVNAMSRDGKTEPGSDK